MMKEPLDPACRSDMTMGLVLYLNEDRHDRQQRAADLNIPENIAIVDSGANLVAFASKDEAWLGNVDIAFCKAGTSSLFKMPSGELFSMQRYQKGTMAAK
jgi:uncharacterized protein GlcG (DUF336 family)